MNSNVLLFDLGLALALQQIVNTEVAHNPRGEKK